MPRFISIFAASLIGSAALADGQAPVKSAEDAQKEMTSDTKNESSPKPYAYQNPYGVGPNNDSR